MKKAVSLLLVLSMALALCACGQTELAKHADETIAGIGEVTRSSIGQIEKAEAEVSTLSEKEVKSLHNLETLKKARADYNGLLAASLEAEIDDLGELNFDSYDAVVQIRKEYESMSDDVKALVSNYAVLEEAEKALPAIRAGAISDDIAEVLAMEIETSDDLSALDAAAESIRIRYNKLSDAEKDSVVNYDKFEEKVKDGKIVFAKTVLQDVKLWTKQIYSHLELYITFKNPNEKTIKYITWGVMFRNPVGDYMEYRGDSIYRCSDTGPYETGKGRVYDGSYWEFWSSKVDIYEVEAVRLGSVEIEYMDGSTITISDLDALDAITIQ